MSDSISPPLMRLVGYLEPWLDTHCIELIGPGEALEVGPVSARIAASPLANAGPCVYLLLEAPKTVLYIGQTSDLAKRWQGHLKGLARGSKNYAKWRQRLFDPQGRSRQPLRLCVIPIAQVSQPLYPQFPPPSLDALESQLIALAAEGGELLNELQVPRGGQTLHNQGPPETVRPETVRWMRSVPGYRAVPLLAHQGKVVQTTEVGGPGRVRRVLKRHPEMEQAVIDLVSTGLEHPEWTGLLYVMMWEREATWTPLYIGKTERVGVKHPVSSNIANIKNNPGLFARWGYNLDYHLGDLSHALFGYPARRAPTRKYLRWAKALFESAEPPKLRHPLMLWIAPWYASSMGISQDRQSLPAAEMQLIHLAASQYPELLNVDGR